jgi:GTPase SAR1 family protein
MAKSPEMKQTKNNTTSFEGDANASKIMKEVHQLYTKEKDGISNLGKSVSLAIHPPRRKINVLIIGNHSAGKSSFVNWYIGDEIQRTGVAIETQGFTFVTSGSKKTLAPIKGDSTVMLYPYLQPLKEKFGKALVENLSTCVSVSNLRHFSMVSQETKEFFLFIKFSNHYCTG